MIFDPMYFVFMIPGVIFMLWAQSKVKGTYNKYKRVPNSAGATGAQAARAVLDANGLMSVPVEQTPGELSDHYDPRKRVLRLSPEVYGGRSISAIGIAAHEDRGALPLPLPRGCRRGRRRPAGPARRPRPAMNPARRYGPPPHEAP